MANTPQRTIRIPDNIWQAAIERATLENTTVSKIVQDALTTYAEGKQ
jgi:hypothetical protein